MRLFDFFSSNVMHFAFISALLLGCSHNLAADGVPLTTTDQPSAKTAVIPQLKDLYAGDFLIGTALDFNRPQEFSDRELNVIKSQFNVITPENSMKPGSLHPEENRWNWTSADRLVSFCEENKITVIGHTLVWHAQTGNWFFQGENGKPVTREVAIERLRTHIHTVVGRYKGKIKGWDVVNEAISDGGNGESENLRSSQWLTAIGPDFITLAFKFAREADPDVELYYNDYNIERGNKHKSSLQLLKRLIADGAPITGVGIQGHWSINYHPYKELEQAILEYKALGLKVNITELDVTITGQGGGQLNPNPPASQNATSMPATGPTTRRAGNGQRRQNPGTPPTADELKTQADCYAQFFKIFLAHQDVIDRVTFWGINDRRSWRGGQSPLLFDSENNPKPSIFSIAAQKQP